MSMIGCVAKWLIILGAAQRGVDPLLSLNTLRYPKSNLSGSPQLGYAGDCNDVLDDYHTAFVNINPHANEEAKQMLQILVLDQWGKNL
ncbi:hypothetical protein KIN20_012641 [Parelaphostrongylus tenuis]|uniref:Uncharacterized protein n=1 Tax=Parelaphostrongylus tenuis TaxID=148309 RepID=A0AAD5QMY2_PARTN|nr:hypothetical protein KIN20_012641 [Parelaphostrongylus tenuis]